MNNTYCALRIGDTIFTTSLLRLLAVYCRLSMGTAAKDLKSRNLQMNHHFTIELEMALAIKPVSIAMLFFVVRI
ncbi:MAG: hypothetical protein ACJAU1_001154 [Psychromonas sp.]|jgi:hypothetical protein